jgi:hypothetical protein
VAVTLPMTRRSSNDKKRISDAFGACLHVAPHTCPCNAMHSK